MYRRQCTVYSVQYYSVQNTVYKIEWTKKVYNLQCTKHSAQNTVQKVQCTKYSVQNTVYRKKCTENSVQNTVHIIQCTKYSVQNTVYKIQCTKYSVQNTVYKILSMYIKYEDVFATFYVLLYRMHTRTLHKTVQCIH